MKLAPVPKRRFRLSDILTRQVGIVDRAANGKVWIVAKDADGIETEEGAEKSAPETVAPAEASAAPAEGAPETPAADPAAAAPAAEAPALKMSATLKASVAGLVKTALDQLTAAAAKVDSAVVDDAAPAPADLLADFDACVDMVDAVAMALSPADETVKADLHPYVALHATIRAVQDKIYRISEAVAADPGGCASALREAADMLDAAAAGLSTEKGLPEVEKSGRRMKRHFGKIVALSADLASLLTALGSQVASAPAPAEKSAPDIEAPLAKLEAAIAEQGAKIEEALRVAKATDDATRQAVAKMEGTAAASNVASFETSTPRTPVTKSTPARRPTGLMGIDLAAVAREEMAQESGASAHR